MVVRDPAAKQRQLLDSALIEFAAKGLVGTRTEDIAARAGCSAGLVYTYFGSKEGLFDAVLDDITARTVELTPITPEDLPGYAVRLYEASVQAPEVGRFVGWYQLQRSADEDRRHSVEDAVREKIAAVAAAQQAGLVTTRMSAGELVLAVQTIARMWSTQPDEVISAVGREERSRREAVRTAVARLVAKD
jgi:AcrR family transcriptional regulator